MLMSKSCKPLHPGLFLLGAATAALVFAAPQTCADALRQGLALCGGPLLVSLFPFLVVSALIMRSGAGEVLGVLLWPVVRCIGLRSRSAGSVLLIGLVGGFAPAAAAAAEAVRSRELTPQEASALLPACICSGPSFVILTVGEQLLGSHTAGICLFAAQVLAGWLTAALLCRVRGAFARATRRRASRTAARAGCYPCTGGGDLPEIMRLCAVFPAAGGRLRAAAACGACTLSGDAAGSVLRLRLRRPHRSVGKRAVLRRAQRAGRIGAAASAHAERCGKLQYFVRQCSAHAARADRLCSAGVRGVLHNSLRGLPPDRKEGTKRSSGK